MRSRSWLVSSIVGLVGAGAPSALAAAQAQEGAGAGTPDTSALLYGVISTVVYGGVGIVLALVGYLLFARILPFDVKKELEEDQNVSVGILLAALVLGICVVVAATIHS